jgi:choline kinase/phosphatidylglycerophosphate synthase
VSIPREAVILAAGMGSRLGPLSGGLPKCLVEVGGRPILLRLLHQLRNAGVERAVIVTGHLRDRLESELARQALPLEVTLAANPDYRTSNTARSLLAARQAVEGGFLLCDGDVVLRGGLLEALVAEPEPCALLFDPAASLDGEAMKATLTAQGRVARLSKELLREAAHGESIGVQKIGATPAALLWPTLESLVAEGRAGAFYEEAFQRLIDRGVSFAAVPVPQASWAEIDDAADLAAAGARFALENVEAANAAGKPVESEEVVDLYVHRPAARWLVNRVVASRLTPDQVTLLSGVVGGASGFLLLGSGSLAWVRGIAAALLFCSVVLDCADGQLARARGVHSTTGATLDGIADYFVAFATGFGVTAVAAAQSGDARIWLLGVWVAIGGVLRSWLFDGVKTRYLWLAGGGYAEREQDLQRIDAQRVRAIAERRWKDALLLYTYARYERGQRVAVKDLVPVDPVDFRRRNRGRMRAWTWLGIGTHFALLYVALAASVVWPNAPLAFLAFSATVPNVFVILLLLLERRRAP